MTINDNQGDMVYLMRDAIRQASRGHQRPFEAIRGN